MVGPSNVMQGLQGLGQAIGFQELHDLPSLGVVGRPARGFEPACWQRPRCQTRRDLRVLTLGGRYYGGHRGHGWSFPLLGRLLELCRGLHEAVVVQDLHIVVGSLQLCILLVPAEAFLARSKGKPKTCCDCLMLSSDKPQSEWDSLGLKWSR